MTDEEFYPSSDLSEAKKSFWLVVKSQGRECALSGGLQCQNPYELWEGDFLFHNTWYAGWLEALDELPPPEKGSYNSKTFALENAWWRTRLIRLKNFYAQKGATDGKHDE